MTNKPLQHQTAAKITDYEHLVGQWKQQQQSSNINAISGPGSIVPQAYLGPLTPEKKAWLAANNACLFCRQYGHDISTCTHPKKNPNFIKPSSSPYPNFQNEHGDPWAPSSKSMIIGGLLQQSSVSILLDSGSSGNVISRKLVDKLQLHTRPSSPVKVAYANGAASYLANEVVDVPLHIGGYNRTFTLAVLDISHDIILGIPFFLSIVITCCNWTSGFITFRPTRRPDKTYTWYGRQHSNDHNARPIMLCNIKHIDLSRDDVYNVTVVSADMENEIDPSSLLDAFPESPLPSSPSSNPTQGWRIPEMTAVVCSFMSIL